MNSSDKLDMDKNQSIQSNTMRFKQQDELLTLRRAKGDQISNQLFSYNPKPFASSNSTTNDKNLKYKYEIILIVTLILGIALIKQILLPNFEVLKQKKEHLKQLIHEHQQVLSEYRRKLDLTKIQVQRPAEDIISPQKKQEPKLGLIQISKQAQQLSEDVWMQFQFSKLAFSTWIFPNPKIDQAEYYRLNKLYNLDEKNEEKCFCIMSPFRNLLKYGTQNASFHLYLKSINEQNYSNYHVYMIDDGSIDNSTEAILEQLKKYPRLSNRITILKNKIGRGALYNRDTTTRKYCKSGDIVMDVDGDDALIGKQTFNLFNKFYSNPNAWYVYSNFIQIKASKSQNGLKYELNSNKAKRGICKAISERVHRNNTYRIDFNSWSTSQLRTYLRDLYMKIPLSYLLEKTENFFLEASDRFVMYSLVQLAGIDHTFYYEHYNYFYFQPNIEQQAGVVKSINSCFESILFYSQAQSRMFTPLRPLKSLNATAQLTRQYQIPIYIWAFYGARQFMLTQCLLKNEIKSKANKP